jgi:type II secretory pathway pseudopilin PulG
MKRVIVAVLMLFGLVVSASAQNYQRDLDRAKEMMRSCDQARDSSRAQQLCVLGSQLWMETTTNLNMDMQRSIESKSRETKSQEMERACLSDERCRAKVYGR